MILVTGAAGFIGSVLVKDLNRKGFNDLVLVDKHDDCSNCDNLKGSQFSEYIHADNFFSVNKDRFRDKWKFIFHLGACSSTTEMNMDFLMENNVNFSKKIFQLATNENIPLIYASSAATYGLGKGGYADDHTRIPELSPLNPYGRSKQIFDEWVLQQSSCPEHWYGIKFFNVYGPNEYHKEEMRSIVHKAYDQIQQSGEVKLFKSYHKDFNDGYQLRDFVYVRDCVQAMLLMMDKKGTGIYNMGTGKARSFYDLVDAVFKSMGRETKVRYIEMPESIRDQYQYYTQAEMDKLKRLIPEHNFSSLEEGVKDYVQNFLQNKSPFY